MYTTKTTSQVLIIHMHVMLPYDVCLISVKCNKMLKEYIEQE